jgi:hypothetical protein
MDTGFGRRGALKSMGFGIAAGAAGLASLAGEQASAAIKAPLLPAGAKSLEELSARLNELPRRRDFKTVPMILNDPDQWDHEALSQVIGYRGAPKQVWDNTDIAGPWLNLMRNSLNAQIWSFRNPDFLVVSGTHFTAHLALFDAPTWDKYQLGNLTGGKPNTNTLVEAHEISAADAKDYENPQGTFSQHENSIPVLQQRGVVFLACHNAIWEIAAKLIGVGVNPEKSSHEALAADLTNHLIPGAVLTPGMAGTFPELQRTGFAYAK